LKGEIFRTLFLGQQLSNAMEFWDSKIEMGHSDIQEKMSSDDDDILKHVQNLDIGDNFMDDDDLEDSYDTEDRGRDVTMNGRDNNEDAGANGDYPDDLSDISDLFENDAHLLNLDIGLSNEGVSKNKEVQMLSLDEVPYSRDLKWINTPEDDRPKPRISRTSNRFLRQVQGITSQNHGELNELDRHYKGLDQKKREYDLSGVAGSRDRRRGRTSGSLVEVQFIPQSEPLVDGHATRGPGKLVIFDDDPKPSQRRKRPYRPRQARGDSRAERDPRDARGDVRGELRGDSKEPKDKSAQYTQKNDADGGPQRSRSGQRTNGSAGQTQPQRLLTHGHAGAGTVKQVRQEVVAIQTRAFAPRPFSTPTSAITNTALNLRSAPFVPSQPVKQQHQHHLISETNAIKLRADAPAWTPYAYT
jgi:hypothetical protein